MFAQRITDDLEVRLLLPHHAEALLAVVAANRAYLRRWLTWVDGTTSPEVVRNFIQGGLTRLAENGGFEAGIWYQGQLVGTLGVFTIQWEIRATEIGYWLAEDQQGKGLVSACVRATLDYLFHDMRLNRVQIRAATANLPSRAIPERLGFHHDGTLRDAMWLYDHYVDLEVYSLLAREAGKLEREGGV